jgi:hypothetical protein
MGEPIFLRVCGRSQCAVVGAHSSIGPGETCMICGQPPQPDPPAEANPIELQLKAVRAALGCRESDVVGWAARMREDVDAQRGQLLKANAELVRLREFVRIIAVLAEACPDGVPSQTLALVVRYRSAPRADG